MSTQCILPTELIFHILYYTNPQDIVRWRTVSKWFRAITHDPAIWKVLYANAPFIRPHGPFPSQSTASLERALVRSARLTQSWTTQSLRTVSRVEIPFDGEAARFFSFTDLIGGRWLIMCQSKRRIVLYDIDAHAETRVPQILWENEEEIASWDKCSVIFEEGQWVLCVLLSEERFRRWRLIEFQLDGESGALCDTIPLDVPGLTREYPRTQGGRSPFIFVLPLQLIFDTRTHLFYEFPKFRIATDETRYKINPRGPPPIKVMLTNTHIFGFVCYSLGQGKGHMTLMQAFTVPDNQPLTENGNGILRLTHEGILFQRTPFAVIRNSVVDPITGSIGVRFLCEWIHYEGFHPKCVDLTLHKPSPVDVSPITIRWHAVLTNEKRPLHQDFDFAYNFFDCLGDGYARSLFTIYDDADAHRDVRGRNRSAMVKLTIDATEECCVATLGQFFPPPAEWKDFPCSLDLRSMHFDCIRGRLLCYIRFDKKKKSQVLVVTDIE